MTLRYLHSDKTLQFSGTDLYFILGAAAFLLPGVDSAAAATVGSVFKLCFLSHRYPRLALN